MSHVQLRITLLITLLPLWRGKQVSALRIQDRTRTQFQPRELDNWVPIQVDNNLTTFYEYMKTMTEHRRQISDKEEALLMAFIRDVLPFHRDMARQNAYLNLMQVLLQYPPNDGLILEFGVRDGFSANMTARLLKPSLRLYGFDTFEGLPEDWGGTHRKGIFSQDGVIPPHDPNIEFHKGFFNTTLGRFLSNHTTEKLGFVNIDCDLYAGAIEILHALKDRMRPGSVLHFHEFMGIRPMEGELKAFHEFVINNKPNLGFEMYNATGAFGPPVVLRAVGIYPPVIRRKKSL